MCRYGKTNKVEDALSRKQEDSKDEEFELRWISWPLWQDFLAILEEVQQDPFLSKIKQDLESDPVSHPYFTLEHGRLNSKGRLVISTQSGWIHKLIVEFHVTHTRGHLGHIGSWRNLYIGLA